MKEQLIQYVELLFAGADHCEDIKQEILQNTLDRYDDLIAQGKVPEAAYRLAISGIGDLGEILGSIPTAAEPVPGPDSPAHTAPLSMAQMAPIFADQDNPQKKLLRAIAVGLYIVCPIPLLILAQIFDENDMAAIIGVCLLLIIVAVATILMILGSKKEQEEDEETQDPMRKSIYNAISAIGVALYFVLSFLTGAWHVTWVIFPITGAVKGLVHAIFDYKEACKHET